uniref:Uncharacterized protein n=11 Tax=Aegilops tauschii subsp. strangulata TaxID=200361 RepID=A0A453R8G6_AEGTS
SKIQCAPRSPCSAPPSLPFGAWPPPLLDPDRQVHHLHFRRPQSGDRDGCSRADLLPRPRCRCSSPLRSVRRSHRCRGGPSLPPMAMAMTSLQDVLQQIFEYNGSPVVEMVGKNCFAIASDYHLGVQLQTIATDFQRAFKIHGKLYISLSGLTTDAQTLQHGDSSAGSACHPL